MTHDEMIKTVIKNIEDRNAVFDSLYTEISSKLKERNVATNTYIDHLFNYARKLKKPVKSINFSNRYYYRGVVHSEKGIRYSHHSYGPNLASCEINITDNAINVINHDLRSGQDKFTLPLDAYNVDILKAGIPLINNYNNLLENKDKDSTKKELSFVKDKISFTIATHYGSFYGSYKYDTVVLNINEKPYEISKKSITYARNYTLNDSNCFFDIEAEKQKEAIIKNFIPLLDKYLEEKNKTIIEAENKIKEFLSPHLVMLTLKNK